MGDEGFSWVSVVETLLATAVGGGLAFLGSWVLFLREKRDRDQAALDEDIRAGAARALWESHVFAADLRQYLVEAERRAWAHGLRPSSGVAPAVRQRPTAGSVLAAFEVLGMVAESTGDGFADALQRVLDVWQVRAADDQARDVELIAQITAEWARSWRDKKQATVVVDRVEVMIAAWAQPSQSEDEQDLRFTLPTRNREKPGAPCAAPRS